MNYGHGGLISAHKDTYSSAINETNCSEHISYGGQRILTFMMYLTNLALGGNTIFPNIGLSVNTVIQIERNATEFVWDLR